MIAEHDLERRVGERWRLRGGAYEANADAGRRYCLTRVVELTLRIIESGAAGAALRQRNRPLGGTASEFQNVAAVDIAE